MKVFDTDIFTDLLQSRKAAVDRALTIPRTEQAVSIVTTEEILRGRLNVIRQAEAGKGNATLPEAYEWYGHSLEQFRLLTVLPFTDVADMLVRSWRAMKIRIGAKDLRITATVFAHQATLITRNRRDFEQVPGLNLDVWD